MYLANKSTMRQEGQIDRNMAAPWRIGIILPMSSRRSSYGRVLQSRSFRRRCGGAMAVVDGNFEKRDAKGWWLREMRRCL
jgi:hypothetical protein